MRERPSRFRGLGVDLSKATSSADAFKMCGLDWEVSEHAVYPAIDGKIRAVRIDGVKALLHHDKNYTNGFRQLGYASTGYKVVQNRELWEVFDEVAKLGNLTFEHGGEFDGGRRVFAFARMEGEFNIPGVSDRKRLDGAGTNHEAPEGRVIDDKTYLKIMMSSGHIPGVSVVFAVVAEREICWNGVRISEKAGDFRHYHNALFAGKKEEIHKFFEKATKTFKEYGDLMKELAEAHVDELTQHLFIVEAMSPLRGSEIVSPAFQPALEEVLKGRRENWITKTAPTDVRNEVFQKIHGNKDLQELILTESSTKARSVIVLNNDQAGADIMRPTLYKPYQAIAWYLNHESGRSAETGLIKSMFNPNSLMPHAKDLAIEYIENRL
jgi:hypothetical protein